MDSRLGSDFESFMVTAKTRKFIPEIHLGLPDKQEMHIPLILGKIPVGEIHRDNMSVEMCTPAVRTPKEFITAVSNTLEAGKQFVTDRLPFATLGKRTTVVLPKEVMNHPHAKELGCDPDSVANAETMESVERPRLNAKALANERYAGGHVHISYDSEMIPAWVSAMLCDLFIGVPMIPFMDRLRAPFYGLSTLHRQTRYPDESTGVEYRALDSGWVHDPVQLRTVATGAGVVQSILKEKDHDLIFQLLEARKRFSNGGLLCEVPNEVVNSVTTDSRRFAEQHINSVEEALV